VGEFGEACEVFSQATAKFPKVSWLWGALGWALQYRDDRSAEQSRECYETAIATDEGKPDIWNVKGLADAYLLCGREKEANKRFNDLMRDWAHTGDPTTLYIHGWSRYRIGDYKNAADYLRHSGPQFQRVPLRSLRLCAGTTGGRKGGTGPLAYFRALGQTATIDPMRQRGLIYVAVFDIAEAARHSVSLTRRRIFSRDYARR